jgi:hypothetical protein
VKCCQKCSGQVPNPLIRVRSLIVPIEDKVYRMEQLLDLEGIPPYFGNILEEDAVNEHILYFRYFLVNDILTHVFNSVEEEKTQIVGSVISHKKRDSNKVCCCMTSYTHSSSKRDLASGCKLEDLVKLVIDCRHYIRNKTDTFCL